MTARLSGVRIYVYGRWTNAKEWKGAGEENAPRSKAQGATDNSRVYVPAMHEKNMVKSETCERGRREGVFRNPTTQVQREDCDRQHVHYIRNRVMRHPPKNTQPK